MTRSEFADAVTALLQDLPDLHCEDFNHTKDDRHWLEECPVTARFKASVAAVRAALEDCDGNAR